VRDSHKDKKRSISFPGHGGQPDYRGSRQCGEMNTGKVSNAVFALPNASWLGAEAGHWDHSEAVSYLQLARPCSRCPRIRVCQSRASQITMWAHISWGLLSSLGGGRTCTCHQFSCGGCSSPGLMETHIQCGQCPHLLGCLLSLPHAV
jgi:hypothetical protein